MSIETLIEEIEANEHPVSQALFVSGLMAGLIAKHTGSSEFMVLMRLIVGLLDGHPDKPMTDTTEIERLTAELRERYHERRSTNERQDA